MRKKSTTIIIALIVVIVFCNSFIGVNPRFMITQKDVQLKLPKSFPKPIYSFKKNALTPEIFMLGRRLFYDPILSKDSTVSCATCHQNFAAFSHIDHKLSHGFNGQIGNRNVPALQNLIWKDEFMWDGGINHLEIQPLNPITSPIEMNESLAHVIEKLKKDSVYTIMFSKAFKDKEINSEKLLKSLAQFTGLMISANSRYDKYMAGKDTFTLAEKNGLALFRNKCANCHREPLFTDNSYRNNGLFVDTALKDLGRGKITGNDADNYKFKVPSLRNVEMTYPYMHDGRFRRLKDVLNHYSNPDKYAKGADSTLLKIGVLSDNEKKDVVAFLLTLTDLDFLYDRRFLVE